MAALELKSVFSQYMKISLEIQIEGIPLNQLNNVLHKQKDTGFKVVTHLMPDLPNMGLERDMESFKEFFENPDFRADGLKIYPTLVIRGTGLYEL